MEPLQNQVNTLTHRIDTLYQVIAQLSGQVSDALSECRLVTRQGTNESLGGDPTGWYPAVAHNSLKPVMSHKDVLADDTYLDTHRQSGKKELTPELQIQRLTAQLTAAYNRIAVLEEQLFAQRINSQI